MNPSSSLDTPTCQLNEEGEYMTELLDCKLEGGHVSHGLRELSLDDQVEQNRRMKVPVEQRWQV